MRKILSLCLVLVFCGSCEKAEENNLPAPYMESFADIEECLSFPPLKISQPGSDQSCLYYNYDGDSILSITHYNSGFNCCPEKIMTSFELRHDTIFLSEDDSLELCRCNCLFNVDFKIHNIPPGTYIISIKESYVPDSEETFLWEVDLENSVSDQFCIQRDFYPWQKL